MNILIICGGGASSGFLAQAMRKAAKKDGTGATIEARSESEVEEYIGRTDAVLVGPHLAYMLNHVRSLMEPHGIPVALVPQEIFGRLDGSAAFALARTLVEREKHSS